jgi:type VI secretion system protein ImpK
VERGSALSGWLPLWVSSLAALAALAVLYLGLELSLASKSDRLYARVAALKMPAATAPRPLPAPEPRLAGLLADQAAAGQLSVRDEIDRSVIVVPGSELFEPGGTTLRPTAAPLVRAISAALQRSPGRIELIGHTDGAVTHSARYPSDWDFSVERAHALEESLRGLDIPASRLAYDGRAGLEPLRVDGGAASGWGDGRLEIVLLAGR